MSTATQVLTADDLLRLDAEGERHELLDGVLITIPQPAMNTGGSSPP